VAVLLSYALTTVADVKESLGIDSGDTSKDNLIIRKINQATLMIESYCGLANGHHFAQTTYTNEEYDGTGSNTLSLLMRPVISISSFQTRDSLENSNNWTDNEAEFYFTDLNSGVIELLYSQTTNWNRYRVTYIAGYATIPSDLAEAAASIASYYVENGASGAAVKKKQEGQRSIEYFPPTSGAGGTSDSVIDQLGLDDVLSRYISYNISDTK
jgi:hypothetical protein